MEDIAPLQVGHWKSGESKEVSIRSLTGRGLTFAIAG